MMNEDMAARLDSDVPHWVDIGKAINRQSYVATANSAPTPDKQASRNYMVMLTSGDHDGGKRATLAFAAACAALSLDLDTHVFLIGDGSHWAYEGNSDPVSEPGFPPLSELMDDFIDLGGEIYICATCDKLCSAADKDGQQKKRRPEVQPQGLASVLSSMVGGTSITF
ncbi:MAG: DsrE family protein [Thiobacillaceae bacterium]|jgi:predicted peroxiredoxin